MNNAEDSAIRITCKRRSGWSERHTQQRKWYSSKPSKFESNRSILYNNLKFWIFVKLCNNLKFVFLFNHSFSLSQWSLLWTECLCPGKIHMCNVWCPLHWYLEMGLLRVIRSGEWSPHDGISALIKADKRDLLASFSLFLHHMKKPGTGSLPEQDLAGILISDFQTSELGDLNVCCLSCTVNGVCYDSLN